MDTESERLQALYKTYTDEQLIALSRDEKNLTDAAQTALTEELAGRGLEYGPASEELESGFAAGVPGMFPSSAAVMEQALEPGGDTAAGMAELVTFFDGHELTRACELLEKAGIPPAIRQREGNAMTGAPSWFEVWVDPADVTRAQELLREKMGLFPASDETGAEVDDGSMVSVAVMDTRAEAEEAVHKLAGAGVTARVMSGHTEGGGVAVEVASSGRDRALEILAADLELDPGPGRE